MKHSKTYVVNFSLIDDENKDEGHSPPFLFYDPLFLSTKPYQPLQMEMKTASGKMQFIFKLENNIANSLPQASFGGVAVEGKVNRLDVVTFYKQVFSLLRKQGVKQLHVKAHPACYDTVLFTAQHQVFTCNTSAKTYTDTNAWLSVEQGNVYRKHLHRSEKNKLNKAHKAGLVCEQLPGYVLPLAYKVIKKNRVTSGYPVTMQENDLAKLFSKMPGKYRLFGVWLENTLIATAVCVEVTPDVLYTFYLADDHDYRQYSPIVLLIEFICDYAYRLGYRLVDLGTVSNNGVMNHGLYDFKAHLGASFCPKCTYVIEL